MAEIDELVAEIHRQPVQLGLAMTGGSRVISWLLEVPGGSRTVVEAVIPYHNEALINWLRWRPESFCSARTARAMAMQAWLKGRTHCPANSDFIGIACSASLVSQTPKRGSHRIRVALQSNDQTLCRGLELVKGARDRHAEEELAARLVLNSLAEILGLAQRLDLRLLEGEHILAEQVTAPSEWTSLLLGKVDRVFCQAAAPQSAEVIFPGAFNPLHEGHLQIAAYAAKCLQRQVSFELSLANVDKPTLDFIELNRRLKQFGPEQAVWLTKAPTFQEKGRLFPGATFLVGADTVIRLGDVRYYCGEIGSRDTAIESLRSQGCRFLVFGRRVQGKFQTLRDLPGLPTSLLELCDEVPGTVFKADISSSELRGRTSDDDAS